MKSNKNPGKSQVNSKSNTDKSRVLKSKEALSNSIKGGLSNQKVISKSELTNSIAELLKHRKRKPTSIRLSLLSFADFIQTPDSSREKFVISRKKPSTNGGDYWSVLKGNIRKLHRGEITLEDFGNTPEKVRPEDKANYKDVVTKYLNLVEGKSMDYFKPPTSKWVHNDLGVTVTPDLGLIYNDKKILLVLYVRNDELGHGRANTMLTLMEHEFYSFDPQFNYWILDVKKGKFYKKDGYGLRLMPLLELEASNYSRLWNNL